MTFDEIPKKGKIDPPYWAGILTRVVVEVETEPEVNQSSVDWAL